MDNASRKEYIEYETNGGNKVVVNSTDDGGNRGRRTRRHRDAADLRRNVEAAQVC